MLRSSIAALGIAIGCGSAALTPAPPATPAPRSEARTVQQDVKALIDALYRGDVDTLLRYTHPAVIELQGGDEAARANLAEALRATAALGMQLVSFAYPREPDFLEGGGRRFAVIPTLTVVETSGQRVESLNYQLGVLEPGASRWTYVEGSRIDRENVQSLFPGFPADYEFPALYRKRL